MRTTTSHATWCHSRSCDGDCGHSSGFTNDRRIRELESQLTEAREALKKIEVWSRSGGPHWDACLSIRQESQAALAKLAVVKK